MLVGRVNMTRISASFGGTCVCAGDRHHHIPSVIWGIYVLGSGVNEQRGQTSRCPPPIGEGGEGESPFPVSRVFSGWYLKLSHLRDLPRCRVREMSPGETRECPRRGGGCR